MKIASYQTLAVFHRMVKGEEEGGCVEFTVWIEGAKKAAKTKTKKIRKRENASSGRSEEASFLPKDSDRD